MQGPLHWEAEKGDIDVSQSWEAATPRLRGAEDPMQGLVRGRQVTDFASLEASLKVIHHISFS